MSRPRSKRNKDLPLNLYRGDGMLWRYRHPITGKYHGMGDDKAKAIIAARKLNELLVLQSTLFPVLLVKSLLVLLLQNFWKINAVKTEKQSLKIQSVRM